MSVKILHPAKLGLYVVLSILDLCLTYRLLHANGGHVYESNPIANAWLNRYGWAGLTMFKIASMVLVASTTMCISLRHPRAGGGILAFACSALAIVVLYSFSLINYVGKGVYPKRTLSSAEGHTAEFEASFARSGEDYDIISPRWYPISRAGGQTIVRGDKKFPAEKFRALLLARMRQSVSTSPGWKAPEEAQLPEVCERLPPVRERKLGK
jgi:hypothetical protein